MFSTGQPQEETRDLCRSRVGFWERAFSIQYGQGSWREKRMCLQYPLGACWSAVSMGSRLSTKTRHNDTAHDFRFTVLVTLSSSSFSSTVCLLIMLPFILGCVCFSMMAFPPTSFKEPKRNSPKQTDKQTNKEKGIKKPRSRDQNGFAYYCFRVAGRVHKGTNKQYEITAMLRFPQRANDKTTYTNQAHYCVPRKWKINQTADV